MTLLHKDVKRLLEQMGGKESIRRRLRMPEDRTYLDEHWAELHKQFGESWVALSDKAVVESNPDLEGLITQLLARNMSPEDVVIDYLTANPANKLL